MYLAIEVNFIEKKRVNAQEFICIGWWCFGFCEIVRVVWEKDDDHSFSAAPFSFEVYSFNKKIATTTTTSASKQYRTIRIK